MNSRKFRPPALGPWQRAGLYLLSLACMGLSVAQAAYSLLPPALGYLCYIAAAGALVLALYYLISGIKGRLRPGHFLAAHPKWQAMLSSPRKKTLLFSIPSAALNVLFALTNGISAVLVRSAWFGSLSAYYILLAIMRIDAVAEGRRIGRMTLPDAQFQAEASIYRRDSGLFLLLAVTLAGMVILLAHSVGGKHYPGVMIYAAAAYSFYKIISAIIQLAKVRRESSPLLAILRRISFIDAGVSILTLQTAMFAAFAQGEEPMIRIMNIATGGAVCLLIAILGIQGFFENLQKGGKRHDSHSGSR